MNKYQRRITDPWKQVWKQVWCNFFRQLITGKLPNIFSKDLTVVSCKGPQPNSENITKIDGLYKRPVIKNWGQINKLKKAVVESMR